jgi:Ethylbenzene dehydrogenase/Prokaryotic cytochrome b561
MGVRTRKTDYGTILLHWVLVAALLVSAATGLRIAGDNPTLSWIRRFDSILPEGKIWWVHILSGVMLAAIAAAYAVYMRQAGLWRRVRPDRARLSSLRLAGAPRWGAINILLYWFFFVALLSQIATGAWMFIGYGGFPVTLHLVATFIVLAYPLVHVAAHWAFGGSRQILRVVRPAALPTAPSQSLTEAVSDYLARLDRDDVGQALASDARENLRDRGAAGGLTGVILRISHPLAASGIVAFVAAGVVVSADQATRNVLVIKQIARQDAPRLDGDVSDPVWRTAGRVVVPTLEGANFDGSGKTTVEIRAVHDGESVYIAFTWEDPTRSLKHLPLVKAADGWKVKQEEYDIEDEDAYYEDKFAVLLSKSGELAGGGSIHLGPRPLSGKPDAYSGRGLHYTTDGGIVDMWHWKASRGGLLGYMDDNYFGPPAEPTQPETKGLSRYKAGYGTDPGKAIYANNFKTEPRGGYRGPVQPTRLPKDLAATTAAMGRFDLDPNQGVSENARWWMTNDESAPYTAAADQLIPVGTIIPGVLIAGEYSGDRSDIRCAARWAAGRWTLEIVRRLDTGSRYDVAIQSGVHMWVAAFDHSQTRHTRHLRPIRLEVQ